MLAFFIHGVATRHDKYAFKLIEKIRDDFDKRKQTKPYFFCSQWGGVLENTPPLWKWVQQDLNNFCNNSKIDLGDVFQYSQYREFFIDQFFGDLFTYLNTENGMEIRKIIAFQLFEFLKKHPQETELHLIAHSLGGVILYDILFSDKYGADDPAVYIRNMIKGLSVSNGIPKVYLRSITIMGSPILLFNFMLGIPPENLKKFASRYLKLPLRWINLIHASDVFAYTISASLNIDSSCNLFFRDKFIASHNLMKKVSQPFSGLAGLSMAKGLTSSHTSYWNRSRVARLITANILGDCEFIDSVSPYRKHF